MANMNGKKTEITRVDKDFIREMKELADFRYFKKLEKKLPTPAEMTRLLRRTEAWKQAQMELKLKQRRENI